MSVLEKLFLHEVLKMLLARGRISRELTRMMAGWRHSGFNVYTGPRIFPREKKALENLAAYLIRKVYEKWKVFQPCRQALPSHQAGLDGDEHSRETAHPGLAAHLQGNPAFVR